MTQRTAVLASVLLVACVGGTAQAHPVSSVRSQAETCRSVHSAGFCFVTEHHQGIEANRRMIMRQANRLKIEPPIKISHKLSWNAYKLHKQLRHVHGTLVKLEAKPTPLPPRPTTCPAAAMAVWGPVYGPGAIIVSRGETGGTYSTSATNGQYFGCWQMGTSERATYGDAADAYGQALAAHAYWEASGRDWSPWSCKPEGYCVG